MAVPQCLGGSLLLLLLLLLCPSLLQQCRVLCAAKGCRQGTGRGERCCSSACGRCMPRFGQQGAAADVWCCAAKRCYETRWLLWCGCRMREVVGLLWQTTSTVFLLLLLLLLL